MISTLKNTFNQRLFWKNNRSSAIYPIDIIPNSNFIFLFINYWKLKNRIKSLKCIITLYHENGTVKEKKRYKLKEHNEINLRKFFKLYKFKGMVQIEFVSKEVLRFPYPAVSGFYMSPAGYISAVHSAGRILNISRYDAAKFSMLISVPTILISSSIPIIEFIKSPNTDQLMFSVVGFLISFIVAYVSISVLLNWVKNHSMKLFVIYRIILGSLLLAITLV